MERNLLKPEDAEELKRLTVLLPQLIWSLEKAELQKKEKEAFEAAKASPWNDGTEMPPLGRTDTDSFSDVTLAEPNRNTRRFFRKDVDNRSISSFSSTSSR